MNFLPKDIENYTLKLTKNESDLLAKLNRETQIKMINPRMLSGHLQGRFLSLISQLKQPKTILEIGTYTGYSALCLAEGLQKEGKLITIDINEETAHFAQGFFNQSDYKSQIEIIVGEATKIIPTLPQSFDLVFIDADKKNYLTYFDLIIDKVPSNGLIIVDNVLWKGHILKPEEEMDANTKSIHQFNQKVNKDPRVENILLPIRDGLMLLRKI
ncbi:MAG TPA: O-methyltransferase [Crocinitomix sp.]|nr:O-methyltransferase [Crocinitomix sp.]